MSRAGIPETGRRAAAEGLRLSIVHTRWNEDIVDLLVAGARRAASQAGAPEPRVIAVDGSLELPLAVQAVAPDSDAVVALGVVIQGETPHFEHVSRACVDGLLRVSLDTGVPVGNGVLTCHTREQAVARAGGPGADEDKGSDATWAAIDLAALTGAAVPDDASGSRPAAVTSSGARGGTGNVGAVKTFDSLFAELAAKAADRPEGSGTVAELDAGVHQIGKKIVEEAAEVWMASEHESLDAAAMEMSQLMYHVQVMMLAKGISLEDVYKHL